jgi:diaminopimelate epimerase
LQSAAKLADSPATSRSQLPGGKLRIRWAGAGEPLWMTGPADVAFRGQVEL